MCKLLLIGADHPLPPLETWREGMVFAGGVVTLGHSEQRATILACRSMKRTHFACVYSWQGCGCGFTYDIEDERELEAHEIGDTSRWKPEDLAALMSATETARENNVSGRASVAALRRYLEDASRDEPVELMCVWYGIWPPEQELVRERVRPSYFADDRTKFEVPLWRVFDIER